MGDLFRQLIESAGGTESTIDSLTVAKRMSAALLGGIVMAVVYRRTHTGFVFSNSIPHTQILLAVGGALIWLVVGDNLVRAFGLAGTIGLIRYRTRISDPKDTTVLLFSMIIGMACGLGQYPIAAVGAGFVSLALVLLKLTHRRETSTGKTPAGEMRDLLDDTEDVL